MVSDDQLRILDALKELEATGYRLANTDGSPRVTRLVLGLGIPYGLVHVLVGFRNPSFQTEIWELRRRGMIRSRRLCSWPYPEKFSLYVNDDQFLTIQVSHRTGDELAQFYASHGVGRLVEIPESERNPSSDAAGPCGTLIESTLKFRVGQEWRMYAHPSWHAQDCGRFLQIAGPGLAQLRIQSEQVESIRAAGLTNGVTYAEIERRASQEADQLIQEAARNVEFPLCGLYSVVCDLHRYVVEILRGTRGAPPMQPNHFVSSFLRLHELLRRAKELAPQKLHLWPTTHATQFAQFSEDSAMHIILRVADSLSGAIGWTKLGANDKVKLPDGSVPFPLGHDRPTIIISEVKPHPAIVAWLDLSVEEIRTHTLPALDKWTLWEMNRDIAGIESKLRDEHRRAIESAHPDRILASATHTGPFPAAECWFRQAGECWTLQYCRPGMPAETATFRPLKGFELIFGLLYAPSSLIDEFRDRSGGVPTTDAEAIADVEQEVGRLRELLKTATPDQAGTLRSKIDKGERYLRSNISLGGDPKIVKGGRERALNRVRTAISDALAYAKQFAPDWVRHIEASIDYRADPVPAYGPNPPVKWVP